jgi:predicted nucleic acid-binding protein
MLMTVECCCMLVIVVWHVEDTSVELYAVIDDERRSRQINLNQSAKNYTLTDATSFAVMERLRIGEAFTFDRHFAQYGFSDLGLNES